MAAYGSGGGAHNRRSTEEQIVLAIAHSLSEDANKALNPEDESGPTAAPKAPEAGGGQRQPETGEWACLQCTFINDATNAKCGMCLTDAPSQANAPASGFLSGVGGAAALGGPAPPSGPTNTSSSMYGDKPPPAASQPPKRIKPKAAIPSALHRRMTTEEQITLAIRQSVMNQEDDQQQETFQTGGQRAKQQNAHRRMTTEEQIDRAIAMSGSNDDDDDATAGGAGTASQPHAAPKGGNQHRRMTTEEQIQRAISLSADDDGDNAGMSPEDAAIAAAIANAGIESNQQQGGGSGHRRMTTEEQIERAIQMSSSNEDDGGAAGGDTFEFAGGAGQAPNMFQHYQQQSPAEMYIQEILENPENYVNSFDAPRGMDLGADGRIIFKRMIGALNDKKQEINKLRIQLNQERLLNQDLRFELEMTFEKCTKLEAELNKAQEEADQARQQADQVKQQFVEKSVDTEETFTSDLKEKPHAREPSYGGIRELFAEEEAEPTEKAAEKAHMREPSYGGIREMFQEPQQDPITAENNDPDASLKKQTHEREPSYNGIVEIFSRPYDEDGQAKGQDQQEPQQDSQPENESSGHAREPSYGGIRNMFAEGDDDVADDDVQARKQDGRAPSYGGIRDMFAEEDDGVPHDGEGDGGGHEREPSYGGVRQIGSLADTFAKDKENVDEDEDANIPDTFEAEVTASFEVVWNLLVEKVHHPEKYLPVEDVAVEHRDGRWIRHMYLTPMELVITEEINVDETDNTVKFVDNNYPDLEIVNMLEKTDDPKVQKIVFFKQNRETQMRISNPQLLQLFRTDMHFLKIRAAQKMKSAVHAREPSYGGVTGFIGGHERDVSYGGVEDLEPEMFSKDSKPSGGPSHARDLSYGGIRSMFEDNDSPQLMAKLQEEVFRVMDAHPWSEITKGMVVQEVEEALGFELKPYHKRFVKITIMRIIDGKLKLECFAGENVKKEVVNAEKASQTQSHNREVSYGGVQELFDRADEWERKEEELDELYSKVQERELDQLYDKAQNSSSAQAVVGGGFSGDGSAPTKIQREKERESVRKTRRHSRNVSYGGVRMLDGAAEQKEDDDAGDGPELERVVLKGGGGGGHGHARNSSTAYFSKGGFGKGGGGGGGGGDLVAENERLRTENENLREENHSITLSKMQLIQASAEEMERLRSIMTRVKGFYETQG